MAEDGVLGTKALNLRHFEGERSAAVVVTSQGDQHLMQCSPSRIHIYHLNNGHMNRRKKPQSLDDARS